MIDGSREVVQIGTSPGVVGQESLNDLCSRHSSIQPKLSSEGVGDGPCKGVTLLHLLNGSLCESSLQIQASVQ